MPAAMEATSTEPLPPAELAQPTVLSAQTAIAALLATLTLPTTPS